MTDNYETITDDMGVWKLLPNGGRDLIQPSEKWIEQSKKSLDIIPEPTELEVLQDDVAFLAETVASSMDDTEMIAEEVAYSIDDSVILAETLASVIDELELVKSELATLKEGGV